MPSGSSRLHNPGRGGGVFDRNTSDLERATTTLAATETHVENAVPMASKPPSSTTNDVDDLEMRLAATIEEMTAPDSPVLNTKQTSTNTTDLTSARLRPHNPYATKQHIVTNTLTTTVATPRAIEQHHPAIIAPTPQPTLPMDTANTEYVPPRVLLPNRTQFLANRDTMGDDDTDMYTGPAAHVPILPRPLRNQTGRYTWRVHAVASDSSFDSLRMAIQEVWDALSTSDPSLIIYPWSEMEALDADKALSLSSECPTITRDLLTYFHRAFPRSSGGTYYIGVRMGHQMSVKDVRLSSAEFFTTSANKTRVGYWYRSLQHDYPVEVGWLLGSTPTMSVERIAAEIYARSNGAIEVGCRWHLISTKKYNPNLPDNQKFKAIHLEVKYEQQAAAIQFIGALFSKTRTKNFVLGTTMRFIPLISLVSSETAEHKVAHCRERQGIFLYQLRAVRIYTLGDIDVRSKHWNNKTMRDLIMALTIDASSSRRLFLSCDMQYDGAIVLQLFKDNETVGYHKAHNLLAYLRFTNPPEFHDAITKAFLPSAHGPANDALWDETTKSIITPADAQALEIEDGILDDDFGFNPDLHKQLFADMDLAQLEESSTSSPQSRVRNLDDDSISTFRSARKKTRFDETTTKPPSTPTRAPTRSTSRTHNSRDDGSTQSEITTESRLSTLESNASQVSTNVNEVKADVGEVKAEVNRIFAMLQRMEQTNLASTQNQESSGAGCQP